MGIRLVGLALNPSWCVLSDRARLVLLQMCYVARDQGTATTAGGQYFGGHDNLIISVLGKNPDALTKSNRETCEKYIQRAIKELKKTGAVTLVTSSAPGHQAVYDLHPNRFPNLGQEPLPVDNSAAPSGNGGHIDPPYAGHIDPPIRRERRTNTSLNTGHIDPPRGEQLGEQEGHLEEHQPTEPPTQLWAEPVPSLWITS
ncbi:MAG: hypothetical protein IPJ61_21630 [Tessaracoccus sp.]|uniref:hypothetical protein n=1 Tax=Tessaracoccus sp. TaxID=1971211 RepID=UPI001EB18586|nr:hypothetical protein [Tessaracoccus sp.]MBK7823591.1 hypothetical protein [Tessaracoccus sp.]